MTVRRMLVPLVALVFAVAVPAQVGDAPAAPSKGKQDGAVSEWVQVLVGRMGEKNEIVRRSVERALVAVGEPALPALEKVSKSGDRMKAATARRVMEQIRNPRRRGGVGRGHRDLLRGLELEDGQKARAEKVLASHAERRRELMQQVRGGEVDRSELRSAMRELRQELEEELKGVLTDEQFKKYQENSRRSGGRRRISGSLRAYRSTLDCDIFPVTRARARRKVGGHQPLAGLDQPLGSCASCLA